MRVSRLWELVWADARVWPLEKADQIRNSVNYKNLGQTMIRE